MEPGDKVVQKHTQQLGTVVTYVGPLPESMQTIHKDCVLFNAKQGYFAAHTANYELAPPGPTQFEVGGKYASPVGKPFTIVAVNGKHAIGWWEDGNPFIAVNEYARFCTLLGTYV